MKVSWDDEYVTVAEIADLFKLNQQTVRNWIDQGDLPALRIGRRVRVRRGDIDRMVRVGSTAPTPPAAATPEPAPVVPTPVRDELSGAAARARRLLARRGGVTRADLAEGLQELADAVDAALSASASATGPAAGSEPGGER